MKNLKTPKDRAIDICRNLTKTITALKDVKGRSVKQSDNSIFVNPSVSVERLKKKRKELMEKYNLTKEDYGTTAG